MLATFLLFQSLFISISFADFAGKDSMNDIAFKDFESFSKDWHLVTIRFRKDSLELRLTYANELAKKTMTANSIHYPDGAAFAKTAFGTGVDEQFISSVVPQKVRRYQIMVKDRNKYATTGGWGYALFDPSGKTFPEEPVATAQSCYACHALVKDRGDVFSRPFSFIQNTKIIEDTQKMATNHSFQMA